MTVRAGWPAYREVVWRGFTLYVLKKIAVKLHGGNHRIAKFGQISAFSDMAYFPNYRCRYT